MDTTRAAGSIPVRGRDVTVGRRARIRAAIVGIAPAVLAGGLLAHPFHPGLPDPGVIAAAAASNPTRWGLVHLGVALGSGLMVLAFLSIRAYLREAGEERWSAPAVPFIVMGGVLYAVPPGMEFAPLAAAEAGLDGGSLQEVIVRWLAPVLLASAVMFTVGVVGIARGIASSGILTAGRRRVAVGALLVMALARFAPLAEVQFYVQSAAAIVAMWPLSFHMWEHREAPPTGSQAVRAS
jgi:hypothetical protein